MGGYEERIGLGRWDVIAGLKYAMGGGWGIGLMWLMMYFEFPVELFKISSCLRHKS